MHLVEQAEAGETAERIANFVLRARGEALEILPYARLEIDHHDIVPGIGEHDSNAASHAAGAKARDRLARAHAKPTRRSSCSARRSRWPRPIVVSVRPVVMKSSPHMAEPMARKARASGLAMPASAATDMRKDSPMRVSSSM